jgi:hypothetical protein
VTDDLFLKLSYFGMGTLSLLLGGALYLLLRRSFGDVARYGAPGPGARLLGRLFGCGMLVASFSGFLSVSVPGCAHRSYEEIVSDREYIVEKARFQASASMTYAVDGLLVTGSLVALLLSFRTKR